LNFANGAKAFERSGDVLRFVFFTCVCAPSIVATVGILVNYFGGRADLKHSALVVMSWWLSHAVGVLVIAPFVVMLFGSTHHRMDLAEFVELTALLIGLIVVCLLVFGPLSMTLNSNHVIRVWLCVPFLLWAAFRFCPLEAAGTAVILFGS